MIQHQLKIGGVALLTMVVVVATAVSLLQQNNRALQSAALPFSELTSAQIDVIRGVKAEMQAAKAQQN